MFIHIYDMLLHTVMAEFSFYQTLNYNSDIHIIAITRIMTNSTVK